MFNNTPLHYEESGKTPPVGLGLVLLFGSLSAVALSFAYAFAINYIPFIYLNFLLTIGLSAVIGISVGKGARIGKIRNKKSVIGLAVFASVLACYFSWVFTVYVWSSMEMLVFNPFYLWEIIQLAAEQGVWTLKGSTPTGAALYAVWGIETAVIIGTTTISGLGAYPSEPFCENCDTWTKEAELTNRLEHPEDFVVFVKNLQAKNFDALTKLRNVDAGNPVRLKVDLLNCSSCSRVHYLTITLIVTNIGNDGKVEEKKTVIIKNLGLDEKTYQDLMVWQKKLDEKPSVILTNEIATETAVEEDEALDS